MSTRHVSAILSDDRALEVDIQRVWEESVGAYGPKPRLNNDSTFLISAAVTAALTGTHRIRFTTTCRQDFPWQLNQLQ